MRIPVSLIGPLAPMALLLACQPLDTIERGCGNHAIEAGEDCDGSFSGQPACFGPDEDNACRFDCRESEVCPEGYGCGDDGVCRRPSGGFVASSSTFGSGVIDISVADADADERPDLVARGSEALSIHFFEDGLVEETISLPGFVEKPVIADLDGEEGAELAVIANLGEFSGIGFFRITDRSFVPKAIASFPLEGITFDSTSFGTVGVFGGVADILATFTDAGIFVGLDDNPMIAPGSWGPSSQASWTVGSFDGSDTVCDEVAIGRGTKSIAWLLFPCGLTQLGLVPAPREAESIALGAPIAANLYPGFDAPRLFLAQSPDDDAGDPTATWPDLVVVTEPPGEVARLEVAYSHAPSGTRGLYASPDDTALPNQTRPHSPMIFVGCAPPGFDHLLAIEDLDGNGLSDLIFRNAIYLHAGRDGDGNIVMFNVVCEGGAWLRASTADLNADGHPDVVVETYGDGAETGSTGGGAAGGVEQARLELLVFINNGAGSFARFEVAAEGSVERAVTGDFDGDTLADIAFTASSGFETGSPTQNAYVVFGRADAGPSLPISMGAFAPGTQFVAGRLLAGDAPHDILAVSPAADGSVLGAPIYGSTTRLLVAPFILSDEQGPHNPSWLAAGRGPAGHTLFALAGLIAQSEPAGSPPVAVDDGTPLLWPLSLDSAFTITGAPENVFSPNGAFLFPFDLVQTAVDFDGDDVDELVFATPFAIGILDQENPPAREIVLSDGQLDYPIRKPVIADFDGDGFLDLAVLASSYDSGARGLFVIWSDGGVLGQETMSLADGTFVPIEEGYADPFGQPLSHALVELDGDPFVELAIASRDRVFGIDFDGREAASTPLSGVAGGSALAAADFDRDGLDDLALQQGGAVKLFFGRERKP